MTWDTKWCNVIFSDEKKFNLDGPDGFSYYWHDLRREREILSKRQFGGGSVMIWAGMGYNGLTDISFIDRNMNSLMYQEVLETHLLPIAPIIGGDGWIF